MFGRSRRYSIQIKDANGASLLLIKAGWTEKERRAAFAEIERLAGLPEVNVNTGPALLEPQSDNAKHGLGSFSARALSSASIDRKR